MSAARGKSVARGRKMRVLCPYPEDVAAGQRLKFEQYYADWRAHGWTVDVSPFMDLKLWTVLFERGHLPRKLAGVVKGYWRRLADLRRLRNYDLVYCFMYAGPLGGPQLERVVRKRSRRLIYDVEDNVTVSFAERADEHPNPLLRWLRGTEKYRYLIREADHVIASSPELADHCRGLNRNRAATYITSSLDSERFEPRREQANGQLTIGWTGTFSSRPYLDLLAPVLARLAKERTFRLRVIGNFDYQLPGVDLEVLRWSEAEEVDQLRGIDIGLYPLPADVWVSGKSGLKAITYMMMGIPCVATNVGTTPLIIEDGVNGLLATSQDDWFEALRRLIDDPAVRKAIGKRARADAVANYSRKAVAARYRAVLDAVMKDRGS